MTSQVTSRAQDFTAVCTLVTSSHAKVDDVDVSLQIGHIAQDFAAVLALMYARFDVDISNVLSKATGRAEDLATIIAVVKL